MKLYLPRKNFKKHIYKITHINAGSHWPYPVFGSGQQKTELLKMHSRKFQTCLSLKNVTRAQMDMITYCYYSNCIIIVLDLDVGLKPVFH